MEEEPKTLGGPPQADYRGDFSSPSLRRDLERRMLDWGVKEAAEAEDYIDLVDFKSEDTETIE